MDINLNIARNDDEKYLYNENNLYLEPNNVGYHNIIWMNCIYNYYIFYLRFKTINNFFSKAVFRPMRKIYIEEEIRHWIFTIRTAIYRIFISSFEHLPMYIKEEATLERYQEPFYLKHYFKKVKE